MKISKIEFENFRNFKDHGEISCSTDGKVTIIYGKNGDGKTTLHQLFQWIFYGEVHFNKTTTNRLYNLQFESEMEYGQVFDVFGRVDFEHEGSFYSLTRTNTYKKGLGDSSKVSEDLTLLKMDSDNNWKKVENPIDVIEKVLPSGLSEYFFFDGESMIADLRVKGRESAGKLKKALYSMFDLDIVESALSHIGRTDLKTTVLGRLYLNKGNIASSSDIAAIKTNIENAQAKIDQLNEKVKKAEKDKKSAQERISDISEQIGSSKSKADYEKQRKLFKAQREVFLINSEKNQAAFGDAVLEMFPKILISKAVGNARKKLNLQIEKNKLPNGISKSLISYLLQDSTVNCICGNPLCNESKEHIKQYLSMLPPYSYAAVYNEFVRTASRWGTKYDKSKIEEYIRAVLDNKTQASNCDKNIQLLDEQEKNSADIEDLVVERKQAEEDVIKLDSTISELKFEIKKYDIYLKNQMKEFDKLTAETTAGESVAKMIDIMEEVRNFFSDKLNNASLEYSEKLQKNIESLLQKMLTSRRYVTVSPEFSVRVTDSFDDEAKSEGQFAVVSFAYIGGILKMLRDEESLSTKEYPLVLDGPFSKLDSDQRQNVVDTIPEFAPQVILFSKDDLQDIFKKARIGRVWTIKSNEEKNVASVQEGFLWK